MDTVQEVKEREKLFLEEDRTTREIMLVPYNDMNVVHLILPPVVS